MAAKRLAAAAAAVALEASPGLEEEDSVERHARALSPLRDGADGVGTFLTSASLVDLELSERSGGCGFYPEGFFCPKDEHEDKESLSQLVLALLPPSADDDEPRPAALGRGGVGEEDGTRTRPLSRSKSHAALRDLRRGGGSGGGAAGAVATAPSPARSSKPPPRDAADFARARRRAKERVLSKALFQHKEADFYRGLPVKPGILWYRSLFHHLVDKQLLGTKLVKSALAEFVAPIVETLCCVGCRKLLLCSMEQGVAATTDADAGREFVRHARAWAAEIPAGLDGCPVLLQKNCLDDGWSTIKRAISLEELPSELERLESQDVAEVPMAPCVLFQRYVPHKSMGPRTAGRPSVLRVAWHDRLAPRGLYLESHGVRAPAPPRGGGTGAPAQAEGVERWIMRPSDRTGTEVVEMKNIPAGALHIAERVVCFMQRLFHIRLTELVVDLVQDRQSEYHFVNVKAFTAHPHWLRAFRNRWKKDDGHNDDMVCGLRGHSSPSPAQSVPALTDRTCIPRTGSAHTLFKQANRERGKNSPRVAKANAVCQMCSCSRPQEQMVKRMTPKMMVETEHHLRKRGIQIFHVARLRATQLSQTCNVCDACWSLYLAEAELCRTEARLARAVGIDLHKEAIEDEAFVPFGGVLASVRPEHAQVDFTGCRKWQDPFRIHDPLPAPALSQLSMTVDQALVTSADSGQKHMARFRRGGEAITSHPLGEAGGRPVTHPVPSVVVQWRMLIHINRIVDLGPQFWRSLDRGRGKECKGSALCLRLGVPWQRDKLRDIQLPYSRCDDLPVLSTTVHFVFSEPGGVNPLCRFLSENVLHFSLLDKKTEPSPGQPKSDQEPCVLYSGHLTLHRMIESPDGFLAQTWVILYSANNNECRSGGISECRVKLTLGLVCDHNVSSEYVVLRPCLDAWVPAKPYFSSSFLPITWHAIIESGQRITPGCEPADSVGLGASGVVCTSMSSCPQSPGSSRPSATAICRDCPALLGAPLLLAPRPRPSKEGTATDPPDSPVGSP